MPRREFLRDGEDDFTSRTSAWFHDLVLTPFGGRTAKEALASGVPPREIWFALCDEMEVPENRRHGAGRLEPRRR